MKENTQQYTSRARRDGGIEKVGTVPIKKDESPRPHGNQGDSTIGISQSR